MYYYSSLGLEAYISFRKPSPGHALTGPTIIVHGGAGEWPRHRQAAALSGVKAAATAGWLVLRNRGSSVDAVETAVVSMEDNPIFNAGTGSALNLAGDVEMDAAIMDGKHLRGGGVAMVKRVRNPVKLARIVMEETDHVLLAGVPAERLATSHRLARSDPRTQERTMAWRRGLALFRKGKASRLYRNHELLEKGLLRGLDTVGALALDAEGNLSAACSTGGLSLKLPGRIGDSAILGAGLYSENSAGAATATGVGEIAIRTAISKMACDLMQKSSAQNAGKLCITRAGDRIGRGLGILTLDSRGRSGVTHNTRHLCWAAIDRSGRTTASMFGTRL